MLSKKRPLPVLLSACLVCAVITACSAKTAEEKGAAMAGEKLDMATGIGNTLQQKGSRAGESIAGGVGVLIKGMEKGVMKSGRAIVVEPTLAMAGLKITRVQDSVDAQGAQPHSLDAYLVSDADVDGILQVSMFDALDREIGRASVRIARHANEAKYETVPLDVQVDRSAIRKLAFAFKQATSG
ncbi:hypothetical protein HH212_14205 [Massilia forsythiae]|uniref:Lipoprotein n=1 Tax=Massilia forsythiae TaxID=2728020 RepID=A0A7Z2VXD7_9BURK|nr:hypothetical protein [Massilia forsythiae]QJE01041.1 hypothetical protein HH212_14205 [Massilia forsythiae]